MKTFFIVVVLSACLMPSLLSSQTRHPAGQRPALERVESLKKVRMMEALKLDENQSMKLLARYNKHRETVHAIEVESGELFDRIDGQIQANASDAEFNQSFAALLDFDKRKSEERQRYMNDLREVLTTKQIAEYVVFERNFARDLREAVRDVKMDKLKSR
jgi:Spy/CpxP family protein refolding chaperone